MKLQNSIDRFMKNSIGLISVAFGFVFTLFISVYFVLGYLIGVSTGKSYSEDEKTAKVDPKHLIGVLIGLLIAWIVKGCPLELV